MVKYLFIILFVFSGFKSQSQVLISLLLGDKLNSGVIEFGLEGGYNFSKISNLETNNSLSKFNLGFYFDIKLKNQWNLYTGVLVKSKLGANKLTESDLEFLQAETYQEEGDYSQHIKYFVVPALLKYRFKNKLYLEAGPQFGLMHGAWVEFNSNENGKEAKIKEFNKEQINRLDAGFTFGTGYKLIKKSGMTLGVKYYLGLANVYKNRSDTKNSSLYLKLNVPIGAKAAQEKANK
ncbi:porin family protein [Flexithrix dorotheae]|uniref:porin family protein n=1 Tax=Flexithrix dorotheae TaxID=70993 RepID=UPI00037B6B88|nr:porin family protein [Flexithrix dorotheae]